MNLLALNKMKVGEAFFVADVRNKCRKANHYWKRYGRKYVVDESGYNLLIKRIK